MTDVTDATDATDATNTTDTTAMHTETDMNTDTDTDTNTNTDTAEDTETDDSQEITAPIDLTVRRQENPIGSSYPWNRNAVVIDAETGDECVCALTESDGRPRDGAAIHLIAPPFAPSTRALCRPAGFRQRRRSLVPFRVSELDADSLLDRLCGTCVMASSSAVADYLDVDPPSTTESRAERSIVPRVVAGRRVIFFATGESDTGDRDE